MPNTTTQETIHSTPPGVSLVHVILTFRLAVVVERHHEDDAAACRVAFEDSLIIALAASHVSRSLKAAADHVQMATLPRHLSCPCWRVCCFTPLSLGVAV